MSLDLAFQFYVYKREVYDILYEPSQRREGQLPLLALETSRVTAVLWLW